MKYMLIMNSPSNGYDQYMKWPKKVLEANAAFMQTFTEKLSAAGELVGTAGLAAPDQAKLVRAGQNGKPITDTLACGCEKSDTGYWIVDVESPERAFEIAAEASTAPGGPVTAADGTPIEHFWIEVRQIIGSRKDLE
jgi:hypothetical protein